MISIQQQSSVILNTSKHITNMANAIDTKTVDGYDIHDEQVELGNEVHRLIRKYEESAKQGIKKLGRLYMSGYHTIFPCDTRKLDGCLRGYKVKELPPDTELFFNKVFYNRDSGCIYFHCTNTDEWIDWNDIEYSAIAWLIGDIIWIPGNTGMMMYGEYVEWTHYGGWATRPIRGFN